MTAGEIHLQLPHETLEAIAQRAAEILAASVTATPETWLDVQEAAEHLVCSKQRIYDLVSQRRVRYAKDGSRLLFRRQWLDDYLEGQT